MSIYRVLCGLSLQYPNFSNPDCSAIDSIFVFVPNLLIISCLTYIIIYDNKELTNTIIEFKCSRLLTVEPDVTSHFQFTKKEKKKLDQSIVYGIVVSSDSL